MTARAVHHLDLWVRDLDVALEEWGWLLGMLGWAADVEGACWVADDGTYLFRERSPDMADAEHDRTRPALYVESSQGFEVEVVRA